MDDQGVVKKPGSSWMKAKRQIHVFLVGDESHPRSKEIYNFLEELSKRMKEEGFVPKTDYVLHDVEEEQKEQNLSYHSEKLAIAFWIIATPTRTPIKVPLDYSLRSYLEVIFLDPRLKIKVQGSLVKSCPLAKSMNKTAIRKGHILGKPVQLILGRSQVEWERMNSGIFLYVEEIGMLSPWVASVANLDYSVQESFAASHCFDSQKVDLDCIVLPKYVSKERRLLKWKQPGYWVERVSRIYPKDRGNKKCRSEWTKRNNKCHWDIYHRWVRLPCRYHVY
ncbi:hypothetical protein IFM89_007907 [Coptis chinensis]|uniref:DYW domain-containing protein n=1 Tax=Coptis chinensis TaxID=261450 RepID=A0A835H9J7_9MAGN|nr:hypothetical protein IFM89_007907 [Coptis chinensis]